MNSNGSAGWQAQCFGRLHRPGLPSENFLAGDGGNGVANGLLNERPSQSRTVCWDSRAGKGSALDSVAARPFEYLPKPFPPICADE
jgi:hypothetical protein